LQVNILKDKFNKGDIGEEELIKEVDKLVMKILK